MSIENPTKIELAFSHHQRSELSQARAIYEDILEDDPEHFDALQLLGTIEAQIGSKQRALELLTRALELNQTNAVVFNNHANVLDDLGDREAAIASFNRAIALKPDYAEAFCNRGLVYKKMLNHAQAIADCDRAILLNENYVDAYCNRGITLLNLRQFERANLDFERALSLQPDYPFAGFNKSIGLLLSGDLAQGWPLYELRWKIKAFPSVKRNFSQPLWLGKESIKNKTILLYGEQGLGDSIQFSRYVRLVAGLGAKVVLEVPKPLVSLFKNLKGVSNVVAYGDELPSFDFQCPLMSLALAFKTTLKNIPSSASYLKSDKKKVAIWQNRLGQKTKPRIGLVWSGSANHSNDGNRSLVLSSLIPWLPEQFQYVVLQKDLRDIDQVTLNANPQILEFSAELTDFTETAALVECMDCVLSVDTSVAHLSAALGKTTWILIHYLQDWRWLLERSDSPWYQSVRLFRQDKLGEWADVLGILKQALINNFSVKPLGSSARASKLNISPAVPMSKKAESHTRGRTNQGSSLQEAFGFHQRGEFDVARKHYEVLLQKDPDHFDALQLLGIIEAQHGHTEKAFNLLGRAIKLNQTNAVVWRNFGNVQSELGYFNDSISSYDRSIEIDPTEAETYFVRGNALKGLHRTVDALDSYESAILIKPDYAQAHLNKGVAYRELKELNSALSCYDRCIEIRPNYVEAFCNRGVVLHELKHGERALLSYQQALTLNANYTEAHYNSANVYRGRKDYEQALACYDRAIACDPSYGLAHFSRADILKEMKRFDEALASYDRAIEMNLDDHYVQGMRFYNKMYMCDWNNFHSETEALAQAILRGEKISAPFPMLGLTDSMAVQLVCSKTWIEDKFPLNTFLGDIPKRSRSNKIRLGYYSADFHNHATAYLMAELFELHDKDDFELIAFSFGPDRSDEMRKRISAAFDSFHDVREKSDQQIAEMSRELQIDIAIDLKGYTTDYRAGIFACRAAPVQVSYIGFPGTMGAEYIDYIIADPVMIPVKSQPFYSEKVVYMPDSYQVNDRKRVIADTQYSREQLGLPPEGFVFCCFNNNYKITPAVFDIWMRLLTKVPGSVLWLLEDNDRVASNLRKEASARGIAPERLVFAPRMSLPEHLARHRAADLFLDTLPYNAHTTASDALWAGLPVLTCMGEAFAARVAGSLLHAMGLPELVTEELPHYEQLAFELACDPNKLAQLREKLQANRLTTPLFDTARFTRHLESAYQSMMTRYHADQPPEHLYVDRLA